MVADDCLASPDATTVWTLPPDLGIEALSLLVAEAEPALAAAHPLVVDASQVNRLHAASLQWLLVVVRAARKAGRSVRFPHPSPAYAEAVRTLGLIPDLLTDA
jgi:anti-anti-sigma regulatory factor